MFDWLIDGQSSCASIDSVSEVSICLRASDLPCKVRGGESKGHSLEILTKLAAVEESSKEPISVWSAFSFLCLLIKSLSTTVYTVC